MNSGKAQKIAFANAQNQAAHGKSEERCCRSVGVFDRHRIGGKELGGFAVACGG